VVVDVGVVGVVVVVVRVYWGGGGVRTKPALFSLEGAWSILRRAASNVMVVVLAYKDHDIEGNTA
jgi:hypothetical protein